MKIYLPADVIAPIFFFSSRNDLLIYLSTEDLHSSWISNWQFDKDSIEFICDGSYRPLTYSERVNATRKFFGLIPAKESTFTFQFNGDPVSQDFIKEKLIKYIEVQGESYIDPGRTRMIGVDPNNFDEVYERALDYGMVNLD